MRKVFRDEVLAALIGRGEAVIVDGEGIRVGTVVEYWGRRWTITKVQDGMFVLEV